MGHSVQDYLRLCLRWLHRLTATTVDILEQEVASNNNLVKLVWAIQSSVRHPSWQQVGQLNKPSDGWTVLECMYLPLWHTTVLVLSLLREDRIKAIVMLPCFVALHVNHQQFHSKVKLHQASMYRHH